MTPVGLEPATPGSRDKYSTTEPLPSLAVIIKGTVWFDNAAAQNIKDVNHLISAPNRASSCEVVPILTHVASDNSYAL